MKYVPICKESGHRAGLHCPNKVDDWLPLACLNSRACTYHQLISVSKNGKYRSYKGREEVEVQKVFVLPPAASYYYKMRHPEYKEPPISKVNSVSETSDMDILYPQLNSIIRIPKLMNGDYGTVIFETVHRMEGTEIYWFIDNHFITSTKDIHQINVKPNAGKHLLTVTDQTGRTINRKFSVNYSSGQ